MRAPATDAVLALAAAQTMPEVLAARIAVIESGVSMLQPLDRALLLAGDGTAGATLLGGDDTVLLSCARRSWVLASAARRTRPDVVGATPKDGAA